MNASKLYSLLLLLLACSACTPELVAEGPPGDPGPVGPIGPVGPRGPAGSSSASLTPASFYVVSDIKDAPKSARASCEPGDVATGGGCVIGDGRVSFSLPTFDDTGIPYAWECGEEELAAGEEDTVTAWVVCVDLGGGE